MKAGSAFKGAPSLGEHANKPGGKCWGRVGLGTQRRRAREGPLQWQRLQTSAGPGSSKPCPDGLQPGKERTEDGYLMLV